MLIIRSANYADLSGISQYIGLTAWRALAIQLSRSTTMAVVDDDGPVALAGLYPHQDSFELFVLIKSGRHGSTLPLIRALVRLAKLLPRQTLVFCCVKPGNEQGRRLCHMAGFAHVGKQPGLELERWELQNP